MEYQSYKTPLREIQPFLGIIQRGRSSLRPLVSKRQIILSTIHKLFERKKSQKLFGNFPSKEIDCIL